MGSGSGPGAWVLAVLVLAGRYGPQYLGSGTGRLAEAKLYRENDQKNIGKMIKEVRL